MGKKNSDDAVVRVSGQSNEPLSRPIHALTVAQFLEEIKGDAEDGLKPEEAKRRLEQYGNNDFGEGEGVSAVKIFVAQIANAMTLVETPLSFLLES